MTDDRTYREPARHNLAYAQAGAGRLDAAPAALAAAVALNTDLHANAARYPDLAALRDGERLTVSSQGQ